MHVTCIVVIIQVACINIARRRPIIAIFANIDNRRSIVHASSGKEYRTMFF